MSLRVPVLSYYKKLIKLCKLLPKNQQIDSLNQIRNEFRLNINENNDDNIKKLIEKASSSISYLKIITPRTRQPKGGITTITFGDKTDINGRKAISNWSGNNLDPDSVSRHNHSLKRAGFMNNSHAKGMF